MRNRHYCILEAAIRIDGPLRMPEVAEVSGYSLETIRFDLQPFIKAGLFQRCYSGTYILTERGRVTWFLERLSRMRMKCDFCKKGTRILSDGKETNCKKFGKSWLHKQCAWELSVLLKRRLSPQATIDRAFEKLKEEL